MIERGEYQNAIHLLETIEVEVAKDSVLTLEVFVLKAEISWRSGKLDDGLAIIQSAEELLTSEDLQKLKSERSVQIKIASLLSHAGILHWYAGNLARALEYHMQGLEIHESIGHKTGLSTSYNNIGLVYWSKGELEKALQYYERSLEISEELEDEYAVSRVLNNLANINSAKGEYDKALSYLEKSLAIKERIGSKQDIAVSLINIGVIYRFKGDLTKATEYYNRSLEIQSDMSIGPEFALAMNNLGEIYDLKGEVDLALEFYQRSLLIYEDMGNKEGIALTLQNMGSCQVRKGQTDIAFEYYQRSLAISEEMGNVRLIVPILSELVWLTLEGNDKKLAMEYLAKLEHVKETANSSVANHQYKLSKALVLKRTGHTRERVQAEEILEQIVGDKITDYTVVVKAMIHLCDLLLIELKASGDEETLNKVKSLTQDLMTLAEDQALHPLIVETYLLQSKLAIVAFEFGQAEELMKKAKSIADEKGLQFLSNTVEREILLLNHQKEKWASLLKQSESKEEIVNLTNLDELLERMVQKTVETFGIERKARQAKYQLLYQDLTRDTDIVEHDKFRVGIAQIGLSRDGDILNEQYIEKADGLIGLQENSIEPIRIKVKSMIEQANFENVKILIFPEMTIDLSYSRFRDDLSDLALKHNMIIIPGSYHNQKSRLNVSTIFGPTGVLWEQEKHIPAIIHIEGKRFIEKISVGREPKHTIICNTEFGRIAVIICRDFLDMDLRVELKNADPPVDIVVNPAFTPVTADFKAAHFDARRSIYAYCFFANVAEFGDSLIYSPEKDRVERTLSPKTEGLLVKDVDLFQLRSERKKWEKQQQAQKSFIQSTRS